MKHRNYLYPPYSLASGSITGTSDSYKKGHSVLYVMCDCKIGKDHETGKCEHCEFDKVNTER